MASGKNNSTDKKFILETLKLAEKGRGLTNPNPRVGAVIVKNGKIIARGYHQKFGGPHAEIEALKAAKQNVKGATMYVSLEPCCHHNKKTPPCTDAIIAAGIKKVVCAILDPNPEVSGQGLKQLKQTSIEAVVFDGLKKEAHAINEAFFTFHEKKRPFVVLKYACSLDGKIATHTHDSKWITNDQSREFARHLRGQYQAILVGVNTVIKDNPNLGCRNPKEKDPTRIILDGELQIPINSDVLRNKNVIVATLEGCDQKKKSALIKKGITVISFKGKQIKIKDLLSELTKKNIISVMVEGGSQAHGAFADEKLMDKVYVFIAPIIIGGREAVTAVGGQGVKNVKEALKLKNPEFKIFGNNIMVSGYTETK